jgi:sortase A
VGRALVTLGLLIFLFVGYQLWGTGIWTARAQTNLKHDFAKAQRAYEDPTIAKPTTTTAVPFGGTTVPTLGTTSTTQVLTKPGPPIPAEGEVEGIIHIPKIGLNMAFVEGTSRDDLKKGPGHYPDTPMPGTIGNAAIAGHRTTYLHPFYDVDHLHAGDDIIIDTVAGTFTYEMMTPDPLIVHPSDVSVVANTPDAELTLTSCNPKFSASQRIVIKAKLVPNKSAVPTKPRPPKKVTTGSGKARSEQAALEDGLVGQQRSLSPTVLWGIIAALVGGMWWWFFRRWRHPSVWLLGLIPFLIALFPFYVYLERALPAGY